MHEAVLMGRRRCTVYGRSPATTAAASGCPIVTITSMSPPAVDRSAAAAVAVARRARHRATGPAALASKNPRAVAAPQTTGSFPSEHRADLRLLAHRSVRDRGKSLAPIAASTSVCFLWVCRRRTARAACLCPPAGYSITPSAAALFSLTNSATRRPRDRARHQPLHDPQTVGGSSVAVPRLPLSLGTARHPAQSSTALRHRPFAPCRRQMTRRSCTA